MPPKPTASRKRTRADTTTEERPNAKSPRLSSPSPSPSTTNEPTSTSSIRKYHIPRGPKGETFLPHVLPEECLPFIEKLPIPMPWVEGFDGTPGRGMTLDARVWWESHGAWLEENKAALKLKAAQWKLKDAALAKEYPPNDDEGKDDWDFVCVTLPSPDGSEDGDEEEDDEDDTEGASESDKGGKLDGKLASLHPEETAIFSVRGKDRMLWWMQEAMKRSQDAFNLHVHNDFDTLGGVEVMENIVSSHPPGAVQQGERTDTGPQFLQFKEVYKPSASHKDVWPELEGLALWLLSDPVSFGCE
jgi:hypothetical protein